MAIDLGELQKPQDLATGQSWWEKHISTTAEKYFVSAIEQAKLQ